MDGEIFGTSQLSKEQKRDETKPSKTYVTNPDKTLYQNASEMNILVQD